MKGDWPPRADAATILRCRRPVRHHDDATREFAKIGVGE
jgi:hypothetical protein